jgi:F-type H+-transporting ATPase subunit epsilon
MATPFQLSVLTPEKTVFEGEVEYVEVPGSAGYLGVLAHHAPLVASLAAAGTLTLRKVGGAEQKLEVSGGFFEVSNNRATVLADSVSGAANR